MRRYVAFFLIAAMTAGLLFMLFSRIRAPYTAPAEEIADGGGDAGDAGDATVIDASSIDASAIDAAKAERPVRVTMLGWELASPLAMMGDASTIEAAPETQLDSVRDRLSRGGIDPAGADVAIMPLPSFVAVYDRLRALEPKAFLVVGFSRGREEFHATVGAIAKPLNGVYAVKLLALSPSTGLDATARAAGTESATLLGLFTLDLLGAPPARVQFVEPGTDSGKAASFSVFAKGIADDRRLALSTSDASRLVPIVAVASRATLDEPRIQAFARTWLDALGQARIDAAGVARRLAAKDGVRLGQGVGSAPDAVPLLEQLGTVEPVSLADEGMWIGSTNPVTLETLMQRTWSLSRGGGITSDSAPDPLPIDTRIATAIAPSAALRPHVDSADADAGAPFKPLPTGTTLLAIYRAPIEATSEQVATQVAFLSGVFERASFRVSAKGGEKVARLIAASARDKNDVSSARLAMVPSEPPPGFAAVVEILALP